MEKEKLPSIKISRESQKGERATIVYYAKIELYKFKIL